MLDLQPETIGSAIDVGKGELPPVIVANAIQHQLEERLQFVKPPDAAVASLLFDYAAIEAATRTLESAERILQLAVEYGYPADRVQPLMKLYDRRIAWRKARQFGTYAAIALAGVGILYLLYRRGIFVISRGD